MLSAPIDRNKEPDPEKHISRINSPYWTMPSSGGLPTPQSVSPSHTSEGVILRVRDTRLMERRKIPATPEHERRQRDNRQHDARWSPSSHHIVIIALERKAGESDPWKTGDRVTVVPKFHAAPPKPQPQPDTGKPPLPTKDEGDDEGDYVLHLSKDSPPEN